MKLKTKHSKTNCKLIMVKGFFGLTSKELSEVTGETINQIRDSLRSPSHHSYRTFPKEAIDKLLEKYEIRVR